MTSLNRLEQLAELRLRKKWARINKARIEELEEIVGVAPEGPGQSGFAPSPGGLGHPATVPNAGAGA